MNDDLNVAKESIPQLKIKASIGLKNKVVDDGGDSVRIILPRRNALGPAETIVSRSDYDLLKNLHIAIGVEGRSRAVSYAVVRFSGTRDFPAVKLHRFLMGHTPGLVIDHKNGNGLDNRRENLRFATISDNGANRAMRSDFAQSGFRGVYRRGSSWIARARRGERHLFLGSFSSKEEASKEVTKFWIQCGVPRASFGSVSQ